MRKKEIIKNFHRLPGIDRKEKFLKENKIHYTYDSFYNMIVWADDGTLQLFPIN